MIIKKLHILVNIFLILVFVKYYDFAVAIISTDGCVMVHEVVISEMMKMYCSG